MSTSDSESSPRNTHVRSVSETDLYKNGADPGGTEEDGDRQNETAHISKYEENQSDRIEIYPTTSKDNENERGHELANKSKPPVKRVHRKGRNEYHCLDDVCILVRVPSSSTYVSRLSGPGYGIISKQSDESLEAYARKVEERYDQAHAKESSSESSDLVKEYESDDFTPQVKYQTGVAASADSIDILENCAEFVDHITFAKEFVKNVISESEANVEARAPSALSNIESKQEEEGEIDDYFMGYKEDSLDFTYIETKRSFTDWPTIENFTVETGAYKIDEYLASFETEEDWMYVIYYQGTQESLCSDCYNYQAIFSLPTWRYPIAQATASLYFTIEVCKVKPRHCPVEVTYKYETFGHIRKPGILDFQEKWLHFILDSKIRFFKTVTY